MDPAILTVSAAFFGLLVGGASTLAAFWLNQRGQLRAQVLVHEAVKREALYAKFIIEASRRLTEARSHQDESPEVLAGLYSAVLRMRLTSSSEVIRVAENVLRNVIEAYTAPDQTFDELRERVGDEDEHDPLREFREACRVELRSLLA
jgi:hypothetical protein